MTAPLRIAAVIVNYRLSHYVVRALATLVAARAEVRDLRVHVVDNASPGDDAEPIARWIEANRAGDLVTLHRNPDNGGFGAGNNFAFRALAGDPPDAVLLVNPDAELRPGCLGALAAFLAERPRVAAVGCRLESPDTSPQVSTFRFPSLCSEFADAISFGPVSRVLRRTLVPMPVPEQTVRCDWVSGAVVMIRWGPLTAAQWFDERYFLYLEETDLMLQLHRAGHEIWYLPTARAVHHVGKSTGITNGADTTGKVPQVLLESWRHYFLKNHGRTYAAASAVGRLVGLAAKVVLHLMRGRPTKSTRLHLAAVWRTCAWPLLSGWRPPAAPATRSRG